MKKTIKLYGAPTLDADFYMEVESIDESALTKFNGEFFRYGTMLYVYKEDVTSKPTTKKGRKKNDT